MEDVANSASAARMSTLSPSRCIKMVFTKWKETKAHNPGGAQKDVDTTWHSQEDVLLRLSHSPMLAPTFWAPLVSRRYSIRLQISLSGIGSAKFELVVPVQIVYDDETNVPEHNTLEMMT
ncbi:uncharacterized protein Z518_10922 [Rhinocladiella mackenziei CBS 650.93]|uniref:Arrestin-like N-terminal domain-containing protein n=1 Tax=Rhinocladiella mackenziei CBS 650.93 TaxID=1442369 RepID=A0A0D2ITE4_9EURO|nr:uncharacterized protein Z518_10922 [Rhinocladiella mackenziei CBS 650.93]KIW99994.1 hypothetical protein Z518_10922 [Rhinocladiella mackenziei CBS 650.93]